MQNSVSNPGLFGGYSLPDTMYLSSLSVSRAELPIPA